MILLLSHDAFEISTEEVQDWIEAMGGDCVRLNGEDLNGDEPFALRVDADGADLKLSVDGRSFRESDVSAVWWRRWHAHRNFDFVKGVGDPELGHALRRYLASEMSATSHALHASLRSAPWLTYPEQRDVNKLVQLRRAAAAGLEIPPTLLTNDRAQLRTFQEQHGRLITKSVFNPDLFFHGNTTFSLLTREVTSDDIEALPERFFPSLVQGMVEKELEVRTFFLNGACYSMAIFSQLDEQTALDYRQYNFDRPNRCVPYRLPEPVEEAVRAFMESLPLVTGSLDLIRTRDGRHVFLEVNPVGQFRMVSEPCNYYLEKKVAEHLMESSRHG